MKNRITYLAILLIFTILTISLLNIVNVKAKERNIINLLLSENGESSLPVFNMDDGYLYPGAETNKDFVLKNNTPRKYRIENIGLKNFTIKDFNGKILDVNNNGDLKIIEEFYDSIQCGVSLDGIFNNEILYEDNFKKLIKGKSLQKEIIILSGLEEKFNIVVSMKKSAGNNMQGLQANFDIVFNATSFGAAKTDGELVITGSPIDTLSLSVIGMIFVVIGLIVYFKKKNQLYLKGATKKTIE